MSRITGLLFDFDGVILETEQPGYWSWQKIYAEFGEELGMEQFALVIGTHFIDFNPRAELERRLGRALDWEELERRREQYQREIVARQPVQPGVRELIQEAHAAGVKVAIVSSSPRYWIEHWLNHHQMQGEFDLIMNVDEVPVPKPAPDLYLAALKRLGLKAEDVVAVEDSPNGSKAAHRAGIFCVIVPSEITALLKFEVDFPRLPSLRGVTLAQLEGMKRAYWRGGVCAVSTAAAAKS
ncbi:HAD-IA family hydrolase [Fontisphaera persica]|uniref:HAD family hydrolase n=1 Tax=Fontisphaera persica TaxID=2974023 RepID=UPI0024C03289|nr:HAD-IA family hydrolase [Fontisphaera persica]WCJ60262.1 HAD-IA family hydrolase [Fontisphaera persica]